jgi:hypothetical protein
MASVPVSAVTPIRMPVPIAVVAPVAAVPISAVARVVAIAVIAGWGIVPVISPAPPGIEGCQKGRRGKKSQLDDRLVTVSAGRGRSRS